LEEHDEYRKNISKLLEFDAPLQGVVDLWGNPGFDNCIIRFRLMVERSGKSSGTNIGELGNFRQR
jgi:hypothetical protein